MFDSGEKQEDEKQRKKNKMKNDIFHYLIERKRGKEK